MLSAKNWSCRAPRSPWPNAALAARTKSSFDCVTGRLLKAGLPQRMRLFLTTGILGGFTTFSAFSLEVALLYERGQIAGAAIYIIASVVLAD